MSLLDTIATKLATDPARWPDRRGDYHADCPFCQKPAKKGQVHFRISTDGRCYCQVCQAGTTLSALAAHLGVTAERNGSMPQTEYSYYDAAGVLAYQVVRFYKIDGSKHFYQRRPDDHGGWINKLDGVERVLYRLPELIQAMTNGERVYIVEGEKDVEMLRMRGLVATTNVGGAGKWHASYSPSLQDADVIILPDNDQVGNEHALRIRQSLQGIAKSVKVVRLPGLADKGDISDWFALGHTLAELQALIDEKTKPLELVPNWRSQGITLRDLQYKDFPPERWIIEGILPEGACLFAAKYKSKKSWLSLAVGIAIAMGGRAIGRLEVVQGDVLYLDLEGRQQRIKKRTRAMLGVRQCDWPDNFTVFTKWRQADEGLEDLEHWLMAHEKAALVIIDVLASFRRPMNKQEEFYRYDRDTVDPINALAEKYHVAIILVHHFNKGKHDDIMDSITGSTGLPSAVNTMWGLRRDVNDSAIQVLELRGRDLENEEPLALKWDSYLNQHIIEGPANEVAISTERKTILAALADDEPHTPKEIATVLGRPVETIKQLLRKLLNEGIIDKVGYGKYARVAKADHSDHSDHGGNSDHSDHSSDESKSDRDSPRVIGDSGTDHSSDHSVLEQQDALNEGPKNKSDRSDRYLRGDVEKTPENHPIFESVPTTERLSLRVRLRSNIESDQEIARRRCEIYGINYENAVKIVKAMP